MIANSLKSLIPDDKNFYDLPLEDIAGALLLHLNSLPEVGNAVSQLGKINQYNFFDDSMHRLPYSPEIRRILLEAWNWLEAEGLLARETDSGGASFFVTRKGRQIRSRVEFDAIRRGHLLPRHQIHPSIAAKVYPMFLGGEYDTAIFQSFREVEVAVRRAGGFTDATVGVQLMRNAFSTKPINGPLTDELLPFAEQEAMAHLFAGAFGFYRNSTAHRHVATSPEEAAEVIMIASQLLRVVDKLRPQDKGNKDR